MNNVRNYFLLTASFLFSCGDNPDIPKNFRINDITIIFNQDRLKLRDTISSHYDSTYYFINYDLNGFIESIDGYNYYFTSFNVIDYEGEENIDITFNRNESGQLTSYKSLYEREGSNSLGVDCDVIYENGLIKSIDCVLPNSAFDRHLQIRHDLEYDEGGKIKNMLGFTAWVGEEYELQYREEFVYDDEGTIVEIKSYFDGVLDETFTFERANINSFAKEQFEFVVLFDRYFLNGLNYALPFREYAYSKVERRSERYPSQDYVNTYDYKLSNNGLVSEIVMNGSKSSSNYEQTIRINSEEID